MQQTYNYWQGRDPRDIYDPNNPLAGRTVNNLRSLAFHRVLNENNSNTFFSRKKINNTKQYVSNKGIKKLFFSENHENYGNTYSNVLAPGLNKFRSRMKSRKNRNKVLELENISMQRINPVEHKKVRNNLHAKLIRTMRTARARSPSVVGKPVGLTELMKRMELRERRMAKTRRNIMYPDTKLNSPKFVNYSLDHFREARPFIH